MVVNSRVHPRQAQISLSRAPARTIALRFAFRQPLFAHLANYDEISDPEGLAGNLAKRIDSRTAFSVPTRHPYIGCGGCKVESEADTNADRLAFQAFFMVAAGALTPGGFRRDQGGRGRQRIGPPPPPELQPPILVLVPVRGPRSRAHKAVGQDPKRWRDKRSSHRCRRRAQDTDRAPALRSKVARIQVRRCGV